MSGDARQHRLTILWLLAVAVILADFQDSRAQFGTISGGVEDAETGLPLIGANILLVETHGGVASGPDGSFIISPIASGTYTARVSFVGYRTHQERIVVGLDTLQLHVRLEPDHARYDEVVITGMATERSKATADVAVSRLDAKKFLENNQYRSVDQLINGKVSGLSVQTSTGNIAGGAQMLLRTKTGIAQIYQPVVYVDGARIESGAVWNWASGGQDYSILAQLNPSDIEKIDVLKGPAGAALYGTSGSNGVVLITTSRGSYGSGVAADYTFTVGANGQAEKYDVFTASTPDAANAIFRTGMLTQHTLAFRGGSQTVRFYTSYDRSSEDGHIGNNSQDRNSFRASIDAIASSKVSLRATASYLANTMYRPQNDENSNGYLLNVTLYATPYTRADSAAIENFTNITDLSRFIGGFVATYSPVAGLSIHAGVGHDAIDSKEDRAVPYGYRITSGSAGLRGIFDIETRQTTYNLDARYAYSLRPDLRMSTTVGLQAFERHQERFVVEKRDFSSDLATSLQAGDRYTAAANFEERSRELGMFATQEISFQDRLFMTLGLRRDYASTIGDEAPSIFYPRASFAVRLDRVLHLKRLNFLKVRAAYGQAGRLPGPEWGVPLLWGFESTPLGPGVVVSRIGNPEIQPERVGEFEVGFELGLLGSRLSFDGTYYRQHATNSQVSTINPPSSGLTDPSGVYRNLGSIDGWGVETALSGTPIYSRDYSLEMTLLWQWQTNEVTSLGGTPPIGGAGPNHIEEGLPWGAFSNWRSRATFDSEGRYLRAELTSTDEDGDGVADQIYFGTPYPKQNGSFLLSFRFLRNFRLSALADWQLDRTLLYEDQAHRAFVGTDAKRNIARVQIGAIADPCTVNLCDDNGSLRSEFSGLDVTPQDVGSEAYRAAAEIVAGTELNVGGVLPWGNFMDDADFIKLREVSIRYDFTELIRGTSLGRLVRTASFVLAGRNLLTGTSFDGLDPEASRRGAFAFWRSSLFTLPQPRTIYGRFSIGF